MDWGPVKKKKKKKMSRQIQWGSEHWAPEIQIYPKTGQFNMWILKGNPKPYKKWGSRRPGRLAASWPLYGCPFWWPIMLMAAISISMAAPYYNSDYKLPQPHKLITSPTLMPWPKQPTMPATTMDDVTKFQTQNNKTSPPLPLEDF